MSCAWGPCLALGSNAKRGQSVRALVVGATFNFSSSDEDFRVFYYDFDRWDLSDPGDGEHIQFSFWSGIADRVTWSHDPEPVNDLI